MSCNWQILVANQYSAKIPVSLARKISELAYHILGLSSGSVYSYFSFENKNIPYLKKNI